MNRLPFTLPDFLPGQVWLVGAGPGDPGLISLLALHALTHADVIVYDALVDDRVLALAGADAICEFAGKRGGKPSPKQPDISKRLVELAEQGKRVLRLKGGDPFVFGRGAEEALTLVEAGVPFRIVPGITSGVGGLAYAGIPATSRETNSAIAFVTGHDASGDVPNSVDWEALAKAVPVLVFYMALKHLDRIAARLIAAGRRPDEPAAVISRASTPKQRVLVSTLGEIGAAAVRQGIEPPALVVVGEVVRLREKLAGLMLTND
ncbi:uroporphyrinogen-III C-methyltransferase [Telmatospirillum sp.]|uniref:uroporphyrinogen-III C-methyltransferase n=1 Tax=Telmatospirillum sp. TaxID=2079197 RepID=UPI00284DE9E9|nr:uroporphyrinogen-III C-methyltransferase [Telmatospirillum sp.]MDR3437552.1 uroporphyrinogen-III C-methyltransferase [Telmatospirillum sp.]